MTAQLLLHVQKFVAITLIVSGWEENKIEIKVFIQNEKLLKIINKMPKLLLTHRI